MPCSLLKPRYAAVIIITNGACSLATTSLTASFEDRWLPESVLCLRDYSLNKFLHDLIAGVTVGLVALPLAMAFAIASGLTPQAGIYCAVVTGFLISALGGSKTQIGGPTGAFVVVVAGIVAVHGVDGLFMCTVMAGVLLVILGLTGMGTAVKFIPRPIVIGFTNGIAVLIASTQLKDFFGLTISKVPGEFWSRMEAIAVNFHTLSYAATVLGVGTLVTLLVCRAVSGPHSRTYRGHGRGYSRGSRIQTSGRNHWNAFWRDSKRAATLRDSTLPGGSDSRVAGARVYGGNAGRD